MFPKRLCIPAALALLFLQTATARNIFLISGDLSTPMVATFSADPLIFGANIAGVPGAFQVLPSSSTSKYYLISRSAGGAVTALTGVFPNVAVGRRVSLAQDVASAVVTPDGRRLILVGPGGIDALDTSTDQSIALGGLDVGTSPVDVAASIDGTRAYVVSAESSRVTAIDLTTNQRGGVLQLPSAPNAVSVGPNGVVYVGSAGAVYEVDGYSMQLRATIPINGGAGKLEFTPDGKYAITRNASQVSGRGIFLIDLAKRTTAETVATGFSVIDLALAGNTTAYALLSDGRLSVLTIGADGSFTSALVPFNDVLPRDLRQIAVTNEVPRARYLLLSTLTAVYRVDLENPTSSPESAATSFTGDLVVVAPPLTGAAAGTIAYNTAHTVAPGTGSLPLAIKAYDTAGRPVSGIAVNFALSGVAGPTLTTAEARTNFEGLASTRVNIPTSVTTGTVEVTATVGGRTERFTITIGDPNLNPGGPGTPVPTGLQIWGGHGQVIPEQFSTSFQSPLAVRLLDAQGQPVSGATINWSLVPGQASGSVNPQTTTTDSDGVATANFTASGISLGPATPYFTNSIRATAPSVNQEVTLFVTTLARNNDQLGAASTIIVTPRTITARAGETLAGAIQVRIVTTGTSTPLPYVSLRVVPDNQNPEETPTAQCRNTWALSDNTGLASCDLVVGPRPGLLGLVVEVGATTRYEFELTVTPGQPAAVEIASGNNQSGNPGAQVAPLVVTVRDVGGNPLPNVPVSWDVPQSVTIVSQQNVTNSVGRASLTVSLGQTAGPVTIRARAGSGAATFNLTINAVVSQLTKVGGDNQTAVVSTPFTNPVTVQVVDAQNRPVAGARVTFAVTGPASIATAVATTGADGRASTAVTAASAPGAVTVTANSGAASATFNLTVRLAGPVFTGADILDAAGYQPGVSPGGVAYIRARGIAPGITGSVTPGTVVGPLPTQLANVEVQFGGVPAPIYAVSNVNGEESVIVQVPFEVAPGPSSVTIRAAGSQTTVENVQIAALKPGVYTYRDPSGLVFAAATRPDGSYVSSANPARRGEIIRVYATGLGQTTPATGTNRVGQVGQTVNAAVIAGVNNAGIRVVSAELQPGTVGVYIITVEIPADTTPGRNQPFGLIVEGAGGPVYANGTALPIQ